MFHIVLCDVWLSVLGQGFQLASAVQGSDRLLYNKAALEK